jgi:hypothetical protein
MESQKKVKMRDIYLDHKNKGKMILFPFSFYLLIFWCGIILPLCLSNNKSKEIVLLLMHAKPVLG